MSKQFRDMNEARSRCPKCGHILDLFAWGSGWDWDYGECPKCHYSGELNTMTGADPDGTYWQTTREELEAEDNEPETETKTQ